MAPKGVHVKPYHTISFTIHNVVRCTYARWYCFIEIAMNENLCNIDEYRNWQDNYYDPMIIISATRGTYMKAIFVHGDCFNKPEIEE